MTTTGASFFDSFTPENKRPSPYIQTTLLQESNDTSPETHSNLAFPDTPEPAKSTTRFKLPRFSVYEDSLPEWQMLSKSYKSQKQDLHSRIKEQLNDLNELEDRFEKMSIDFHRKVETAYTHLSDDLAEWQEELDIEKSCSEREKDLMKLIRKAQEEKIKLNVGGQLFETSLSTLQRDPDSILAAMFTCHSCIAPDENDGSYFIDRDSTYFRLVLNYLRDLKVPSCIRDDPKIMDELMQEARHYNITGLMKLAATEDTARLFIY